MGMDVFGINPELKSQRPIMPDWDTATDEQKDKYFEETQKWEAENPGGYFRNNVWHWRPLWDYVCLACGDTMTTSDLEAGHYNDGHEIDAEQCEVIVERLEFLLKIGAVAKYEVERKTQDKESEDYPFDEENVIEFVNFVKHSGGFKIC